MTQIAEGRADSAQTVEPRISYVVARLERAVRAGINDRVRPYGLTTLQYTTLTLLGARGQPLSNAQLARRAYMTPQSMLAVIDALEEKGVVRTLAEPNLIALSGDTASFLAGGEFPIPVGQDTNDTGVDITIEFKPFGVSLSFTPTVIGEELINLELFTEVSDIDRDTSIRLDRLLIPGLTTRRARTTVELGNGQSFAIAGLLRDDFEDTVRKYPILGDVPVLGQLFRSNGYQLDQTELVVIVTPYLVQPASPTALITPADLFQAPSDAELFLQGKAEGERAGYDPSNSADQLGRRSAAGIVGPHGYILR